MEKDIVIIGSGGAGLSAAVVASLKGLEVLVVEKTDVYGGATAWSGGNVWAPGNSLSASAGHDDDRGDAITYIEAVVGSRFDRELTAAFLDAVPAMVDFFQEHTCVQFEVQEHFSDSHMHLPGAKSTGRCVTPVEYDGRCLGEEFDHLRTPLEQVNAPFGMMIGFNDIHHMQNFSRSLSSFCQVVKLVSRFARDKLVYGRATRLTMGNALAARLVRAALGAGVQIWRNTSARRLTFADGRVNGLIVERNGQQLQVEARYGVLLASGGFSANESMRRRYMPYPDKHISLMPESNTGDGISMAVGKGAVMEADNERNGDWVVTSVMKEESGTETKCLHTVLDRPKPGCLAVNREGKRFANEASRYMVDAMHSSGSVPAYLICDHRFLKKYGLGLIKPGGLGLKRYLRAGYLMSAPDIPGLATATGIGSEALKETIKRFNGFARKGVDEDFGKGNREEERASGDPDHGPNPCLGTLETPPYYAIRIYPGDASSWAGLRIDSRARVLDADGEPIAGLYAAGLDANSLWRGCPPSLGANNALSLTWGYIAGKNMAERKTAG